MKMKTTDNTTNNGTLFVVATPIGNIQDLSPRAKEILQTVHVIASEDTRTTKKLCMLLNIETTAEWKSFHAHSNNRDIQTIISMLQDGKNVALTSDAGTPAISDPGVHLVNEARKNGIAVSPIPGSSAVISALCASGFPSDRFEFLGFLPHKKGRQTLFKEIASSTHTMIFYESTHRIIKCLEQMNEFLPTRYICIARELTKHFEEFLFGTAQELLETLQNNPEKTKGEFVVLVAGEKHVISNM